jgi:hypothetical protein
VFEKRNWDSVKLEVTLGFIRLRQPQDYCFELDNSVSRGDLPQYRGCRSIFGLYVLTTYITCLLAVMTIKNILRPFQMLSNVVSICLRIISQIL